MEDHRPVRESVLINASLSLLGKIRHHILEPLLPYLHTEGLLFRPCRELVFSDDAIACRSTSRNATQDSQQRMYSCARAR